MKPNQNSSAADGRRLTPIQARTFSSALIGGQFPSPPRLQETPRAHGIRPHRPAWLDAAGERPLLDVRRRTRRGAPVLAVPSLAPHVPLLPRTHSRQAAQRQLLPPALLGLGCGDR